MAFPITFVTGNNNKLLEVIKILGPSYDNRVSVNHNTITDSVLFQLVSVALNLPELQGTIEEISRQKCLAASKLIDGPVLTEDTALRFEALNGMPGPYIKWFLDALGPDGLPRLLTDFEDKLATAVCTFAFCPGPAKPVQLFTGRTEGLIVPPRGSRDFGWDPIFQPVGFQQTYAEMDKAMKNTISHRYKSLMEVKRYLDEEYQ